MPTKEQDAWLNLAVKAFPVSNDGGDDGNQIRDNQEWMNELKSSAELEYEELGGDNVLLQKIKEQGWAPLHKLLMQKLQEAERELERELDFERRRRDVKHQVEIFLKSDGVLSEWQEKLELEQAQLPKDQSSDEWQTEKVRIVLKNIKFIHSQMNERKEQVKIEARDHALGNMDGTDERDKRELKIKQAREQVEQEPCPTIEQLAKLSLQQKLHLHKYPKQYKKFLGK